MERKLLKQIMLPDKDVIVLIGPEGDFTPEEIEVAQKCRFQGVSLGENRLRTETAGIVACMTAGLMHSETNP
jgi:16S rRNA (uracil1498-N3)-methyltransferase